jgi:hypothetical protein
MTSPIPVREVRLRPEYAAIYPEIPTGLWLLAQQVAEIVVRRASEARTLSLHRRTLDTTHFEFRGGPVEKRRAGARTRLADR